MIMRQLKENVKVVGENYLFIENKNKEVYLDEEKICMFVDGELDKNERNYILSLLSKNDKLRRKVSDYVKSKRFHKDVIRCQVSPTVKSKAIALFDKYSK